MNGSWPSGVEFTDDLTPASWIEPRLLPWGTGGGTPVGAVVPTAYPAYVRLLHPLTEGTDRLRWKDLVEAAHLVYHPLIQWERLPEPLPRGIGHSHGAPAIGQMAASLRRALVPHLASETNTPESVYFGVWEGWGQAHPGMRLVERKAAPPYPGQSVPFDESPRLAPAYSTLALPYRSYLLAHGPLSALVRFPDHVTPSLIWPEDRGFCCATEIDFDSTLVGLSEKGAEQILDDANLEALPIHVEDQLDITGDTVNPMLGPVSAEGRG